MKSLIYIFTILFVFTSLISFDVHSQISESSGEQSREDDIFESQRQSMVDIQLAMRGIVDPGVLEAMRYVPRHKFIPKEYRSRAYQDSPLPIGHSQTISQPYIVAYMSEVARIDREDVCLEVGTGSGYQAAILSLLCKKVYTIEIISYLGIKAEGLLAELNYQNIEVKVGDGHKGWEEKSPFDVILVTAAPEFIPRELVKQLREGGRMIIPVGAQGEVQKLLRIQKNRGELIIDHLLPVQFVPMTNEIIVNEKEGSNK
jgi:protein-L-isoaspartate(D-aspartate) O-methyltransferase